LAVLFHGVAFQLRLDILNFFCIGPYRQMIDDISKYAVPTFPVMGNQS
jgi:hypothetical protein